MNTEQIDKLLRTLPREKASDDLAPKVLARLGERDRPSLKSRKLAFGFVLASAVLVAVLAVFLWLNERARKAEIRQEIDALRSEHQFLQARLLEMKQNRPESPVVYLGGDARVDYVLDLRKYLRAQVESRTQKPVPLQYTGGSL